MAGFWSRLFDRGDAAPESGGDAAPAEAPAPQKKEPAPLPAPVERLLRFGQSDGPSDEEAVSLLAQVRRTALEARVLERLASRHEVSPLPDGLAVGVAAAMIDRGEPEGARRLLQSASTVTALMMRVDLEAEQGDLNAAVALVERVLLRDIDHPGARERHRRYREALGFDVVPRPEPSNTTLVRSEPEVPYVLLREVARGGAGAVYEAEDRDLGRRLALKVYHDPERQRPQLLHEARVAAELAGPGVVRVFDVDPEHGFLVLEWAKLGALRDRMRAKDTEALLPVERWALPLAVALARVHAAGWVHLDVKPANVLLTAVGAPLLADFGIARRIGATSSPGSFGYVSPERLAGEPSDPRDDVYGFGRLLEDALEALSLPDITPRFRSLTQACIAPKTERLTSAQEIVTRLRTEFTAS